MKVQVGIFDDDECDWTLEDKIRLWNTPANSSADEILNAWQLEIGDTKKHWQLESDVIINDQRYLTVKDTEPNDDIDGNKTLVLVVRLDGGGDKGILPWWPPEANEKFNHLPEEKA